MTLLVAVCVSWPRGEWDLRADHAYPWHVSEIDCLKPFVKKPPKK